MKPVIAVLSLCLIAPPLFAEPTANDGVWRALSKPSAPARNHIRDKHRYAGGMRYTKDPNLTYRFYQPGDAQQVIGFSLTNPGSKRINPKGLRRTDAKRTFDFLFADRAREDIHLMVADDVSVSGRYSHDNMFRELHFFPRNQLPTITPTDDGARLQVALPTGEMVFFDAWSKEIIGGVLKEHPMDTRADRHKRLNPVIDYLGQNLVITVEQRGEAPRRARIWGKTKYADVRYPARYPRACRLSPSLIWDQHPNPGDDDPRLTMLHATDKALFDTIEQHCGWDLSDLRLTASKAQDNFNRTVQQHVFD